LGSIPPFDSNAAWQAPAYQPVTNTAMPNSETPKVEREQPSLVFVQKITQASSTAEATVLNPTFSLGLPIGTRLRARLETAASTAVKAPVIGVIEYNYEKNGEIVVPAGTKAFGKIEQADRSGYMSIRFDSLLMPDGSRTGIDAVATNLSLGPLRGKVEGKNSGGNALVKSLSGIGEVGALLVSRGGTINQPFSEGDMIRERLSTNIGESADQEVTRLAITERTAVSLSAGTPMYMVLDRSTQQSHAAEPLPRRVPAGFMNSADSLRQLLQLQRELNQNTQTSSQ
jgi:hypothetical protein